MPKARIGNETYNFVKREISRYTYYKKQIKDERDNIINESCFEISDMPKPANKISRPTELKAMRLCSIMNMAHMERTVDAIERMLHIVDKHKVRLFDMYFVKRWDKEACMCELYVSEKTFKRWLSEIVVITAEELGYIFLSKT
jgi:RinA family phage transcriptional activator